MVKQSETVPAPGRLFDADGVLRYRKGQPVPKAELAGLTERPAAGPDLRPAELEQRTTGETPAPDGGLSTSQPAPAKAPAKTAGRKAARKSSSRGPVREKR